MKQQGLAYWLTEQDIQHPCMTLRAEIVTAHPTLSNHTGTNGCVGVNEGSY